MTETPDSPEIEIDSSSIVVKVSYEGQHSAMKAALPKVGQAVDGYGNILIEKVALRRMKGGKGSLQLTLKSFSGDNTFPAPIYPIYEIEWTQIERPIEQAAIFRTGGTYALTDDDLTKLKIWEDAAADARTAAYGDLSDNAKKLADKKKRGETTVVLFGPVIRITTQARNVSNAPQGCGKIVGAIPGLPQLPVGLDGKSYVYLQTADRSTRSGETGRWQNTKEYTGAEWWDTDLYQA